VPCSAKASASAIASSIASFVPEPIEKCAVWAASPTSTMFSWCQHSFRTVGNARQTERLMSSSWPSRWSAKSTAMYATVSSSVVWSSPARRQVSSWHSTMNVLCASSKGYACTWNRPCSFSRKMNVNASSTFVVPSQVKRFGRQSRLGLNVSACASRMKELMPSAARIRSASANASSESTSLSKCSSTPSSRQRSWKICSNFLRASPAKPWPVERTHSPR
jgi:hypothetical protein